MVAKNLMDDCKRPACDDMMSKLQAASKAAATTQPLDIDKSTTMEDCPMNSAQLGRSSWGLLHTMAAWYPDNPSAVDEKEIKGFFGALARFYPCPWCAKDFQESIQKNPVQTRDRQSLCQWLCEEHNKVNTKLGKAIFPCDINALDERWRTSHHNPNCQPGAGDH